MTHQGKKALVVVLLVLIVVTAIAFVAITQPWDSPPDPATPTQTQAPSDGETYWDEDKMESASPAPMPGD